ncbi:MAG TPA: exodeoxyribonuclease VII large subunit [Candidatus Aminicenantes bacterium]|nr:exodeoxyribonuclease VII large subunit [Candidatus Aminicenantes bacterium]
MNNLLFDRERILPVSELNALLKGRLESEFPLVRVAGETSGVTYAASGHLYLTLKDATGSLRVVMFRGQMTRSHQPRVENGREVVVKGQVSMYAPRGEVQLIAQEITAKGVGDIYAALERLKTHYQELGYFDPQRKKRLPLLPRRIGVVTSPTGAAVRDIVHVLHRRFPGLELILYPAKVQGEGASAEVAAGIDYFNAAYQDLDVMIVGRGGGAYEDLWAFNEPPVVEAIHASRIPVISAVGHEIDFTIADFVADLRAPTPSAAAEMVVGRKDDFLSRLAHQQDLLGRRLERNLHSGREALWDLLDDTSLPRFAGRVMERAQRLDNLDFDLHRRVQQGLRDRNMRGARLAEGLARLDLMRRVETGRLAAERSFLALQAAMTARRGDRERALATAIAALEARGPEQVLARGYSITTRGAGEVVRDAADLRPGETLNIRFHRGETRAVVAEEER